MTIVGTTGQNGQTFRLVPSVPAFRWFAAARTAHPQAAIRLLRACQIPVCPNGFCPRLSGRASL